ncbi:MAG: TadE/TadG family type IV pilus assembly protein [Pseudomonadota bacterium]
MLKKTYSWRNVRGIVRANDGISAVEFALIAPLMVLMYMGSIELSFMMTLDRKVTSAAAALGDLTARDDNVTDADMAQIFQATRMVMEPNDIVLARMRVSSLEDAGCNDNVTVGWSDGYGFGAYPVGTSMTVPDDIVPTCGSAIFAEFEYDYRSPFGFFITQPKTLSDEFYLRPRRSNFVARSD